MLYAVYFLVPPRRFKVGLTVTPQTNHEDHAAMLTVGDSPGAVQ